MKTTKKHFAIFKKECEKWIRNWGFTEWEIRILHKDLSETNSKYGRYEIDCYDKIANIMFDTEWDDEERPLTESEIKNVAFHEAGELLLVKLSYLAKQRYVTSDEILSATHEIINKLANYLMREK